MNKSIFDRVNDFLNFNFSITTYNKYACKMMDAIKEAQTNKDLRAKSSKTDGLRVIKRFEKVNKIDFDPFDPAHIDIIGGNGPHEEFFRIHKLKNNE